MRIPRLVFPLLLSTFISTAATITETLTEVSSLQIFTPGEMGYSSGGPAQTLDASEYFWIQAASAAPLDLTVGYAYSLGSACAPLDPSLPYECRGYIEANAWWVPAAEIGWFPPEAPGDAALDTAQWFDVGSVDYFAAAPDGIVCNGDMEIADGHYRECSTTAAPGLFKFSLGETLTIYPVSNAAVLPIAESVTATLTGDIAFTDPWADPSPEPSGFALLLFGVVLLMASRLLAKI